MRLETSIGIVDFGWVWFTAWDELSWYVRFFLIPQLFPLISKLFPFNRIFLLDETTPTYFVTNYTKWTRSGFRITDFEPKDTLFVITTSSWVHSCHHYHHQIDEYLDVETFKDCPKTPKLGRDLLHVQSKFVSFGVLELNSYLYIKIQLKMIKWLRGIWLIVSPLTHLIYINSTHGTYPTVTLLSFYSWRHCKPRSNIHRSSSCIVWWTHITTRCWTLVRWTNRTFQ